MMLLFDCFQNVVSIILKNIKITNKTDLFPFLQISFITAIKIICIKFNISYIFFYFIKINL